MSAPTFQISDFRYIDAHIHFFPDRLFQSIWAYWDRVYLPWFPTWINRYQWPTADLVAFLRNQHVERYTTLNYAHKKGVAEGLNEWTHAFCEGNPAAIAFGTSHPADVNFLEYAEKALTQFHFQGFKFQLMVTDFYIHDPRLKPLYKLCHNLDKILVFHAGTAPSLNQQPIPDSKVGFQHFLKFFREFPENKMIIAHMGGYEYRDFFKIVEQHPNVYLDTTMVFIPRRVHVFPEADNPMAFIGESALRSFMEQYSEQLVYGSDFPNIPYSYEESIKGLFELELSKSTYQNIFFNTAKKLFKLTKL